MSSDAEQPKQNKWTKEYMREYQREYMRNRWRRVHGVKPENYKFNTQQKKVELAQKFGEQAVEFYKELKKTQDDGKQTKHT